MHISITKSTASMFWNPLSPIWFGLLLYMQDSACVQLWVYGGESTSEITPERRKTAQYERRIEVL